MKTWRLSLVLLSMVALSPRGRGAATGVLTGSVDKPAAVTAVTAIDRETDKKYLGKVDLKTGRFTIEGLPLGKTYDCILDAGGVRLEGVSLKVPRSDYEEEQPLSKADVAAIKKISMALNKFENEIEIMTVMGNIQHAAVILNKKRTTPFINSKEGEMIWRLELWHFTKPDETWLKSPDELFLVLYRERLQKTAFAKKALTLDGALGGHQLTVKKPRVDLGKIELPSKDPGIRLRDAKSKRK